MPDEIFHPQLAVVSLNDILRKYLSLLTFYHILSWWFYRYALYYFLCPFKILLDNIFVCLVAPAQIAGQFQYIPYDKLLGEISASSLCRISKCHILVIVLVTNFHAHHAREMLVVIFEEIENWVLPFFILIPYIQNLID